MPFQSEKQRRFLHANHPEIAKRWEREYATGGISNHFRKRFFTGALADTQGPAGGQAMSPGTSTTGGSRNIGGGQGNQGNQNDGGGPPIILNPPKKPKPKPEPKKDKKEDSSGFLIDVRKRNKKKYLDLLKKYEPDDFDIKNIIRGKSKLSEEEAKFIEPYRNTIWDDLSKISPEHFFNIYEGVAPKVDSTQNVSPLQYEWAKADPSLIEELSTKDYDFSEIEGLRAELTDKQKKFIDKKTFPLKENLISPQSVYETITNPALGVYDKGIWGIGEQEPTTIEEYNEYLKSKDLPTVTAIGAKGGLARKNYFHGGLLDITGEEEIISDDGNDIELTAYNAEFDDPKDLSTGVKTLFQAKDGGTPQLAKKSKDGKRPGYGGPHDSYDAGQSYSGSQNTGRSTNRERGIQQAYSQPAYSPTGDAEVASQIAAADRKRKAELKNLVATGPGSDVEKYDTDLVDMKGEPVMTPEENYLARRNMIKSKYTGKSIQRKNALTKNYNDEREKLEKAMNKKIFKIFGLAILGQTPTLGSLVNFDPFAEKKLTGLIPEAYALDQLKKQHIADLTDIKDSLLADVDINNPNEMANLDDTAFPDVMKELKDLTKPRDEEDDTGGDGGIELPPQLGGPSTEEMATEYRRSNLERIRAAQALREQINPDWQLTAEAKELKNNPIVSETETDIIAIGNKGGLANLFRVKNQ